MILLPNEGEEPVATQVNAVIGQALRQSVADMEPSPGFAARLASALDAMERGGEAGVPPKPAPPANTEPAMAEQGAPEVAGRGSGAVETAS